jgi:pyruvate dehydrogenase E1 component alpha subunit
VPSSVQTASRTFAAKAAGYGMPGVRVDGNDVLAMWQVASDAIDRARAGDGPTMIEALTCRVPGDSSSDDPPVYRDPGEPELPESWERKDPLNRLRNYLRHRGMWSERSEAEQTEACHQQITDALAVAERTPAPAVESLFDDVHEELPWHLREQRAYLLAQRRTTNPHHPGQS